MKIKSLQCSLLSCVLLAAAALACSVWAEDAPKSTRPDIYDESADGGAQIADALGKAKKEGKRVLLQFGANWCGWCHKLHSLCETNKEIHHTLEAGYVVVLIDVNEGRNKETNAKYGNPTRFGLPVIVILDADGKQLTTKDSGELEEGDHHSPEKVLAFLKKWALKRERG